MPLTRRRVVRRRPPMRRRRYVRRPIRKYRLRTSRPVRLTRSVGFARKLITKLRYCEISNLTLAIVSSPCSTVYCQQFQTSLYDPDLTGTGHQPMYYDQLCSAAGIYRKYRVYGIGYEMWFQNTNTNQMMPVLIHHTNNSGVISSTNWLLVEEQTGVRPINVGSLNDKPTYVKGYLDVAKALGCTRNDVRTEDDFEALYNANPARMAYLNIYMSSFNVSAGNVLNVRYRLTYYCELSELANAVQS